MYVFDLESKHGVAWGEGLRHEGVLTPQNRLQIGPFIIRLSRAPAFMRSLEPTSEDWELENEPLENIRLWFENAAGRRSGQRDAAAAAADHDYGAGQLLPPQALRFERLQSTLRRRANGGRIVDCRPAGTVGYETQ